MPTPKRQNGNFLASQVAKKLLESQSYQDNLKTRLEAGVLAPAVEAMLWAYAYGKPVETMAVTHHFEKLEALSDEELTSLEHEVANMPVIH